MTTDLETRTTPHPTELFAERGRAQEWGNSRSGSRRRFTLFVVALAAAIGGLLGGLTLARTLTGAPAQPIEVLDSAGSSATSLSEVALAAATIAPSVVQIETETGLGSGVYSVDGFIPTAAHVIEGAEKLDIRLADGRLLVGTVVGTHTPTDLV